MDKDDYINFLKGTPVDLMQQIRAIEDFIYQRRGVSVRISNPNYISGKHFFMLEAQRIIAAFTFICNQVLEGTYEPS